jgi:hypothetical protein
MSLLTQASLVLTPNAYKANKLYSIIPSSGNGDMTTTRATTATRVNSSGLVENVATGIPRVDYTGGVANILLEPQRTNSIPNSTMAGAVLNTTTMPTGWQSNTNGLTQTIVGIGTENGLNYIDIRFNGIASTSGNSGIRTTNSTTIAALQNQNWTFSSYVKILAQPLPATFYQLAIYERSNTGAFLQTTSTAFNNTTLNRISHSSTLANASTAYVQSDIIGGITSGQSYDFTLRIAGTQLEVGSYATSYIPTTTSTVTRNQDIISRDNIYTNNFITSSGGTWFVELNNNFALTRDAAGTFQIGDLLGNNFSIKSTASNTRLSIVKNISNVQTVLYTTLTDIVKIAIDWNGTTADIFVNGIKVVTATSFTTTNMNSLTTSISDVPRYIKSTMLFPTPLTDAECISLTTL